MRISDLRPMPGSRRARKRVGRGAGSGHGKTSCRGNKGQKARSKVARGFEGGQMPLQRRLPKRGFRPYRRVENQVVNVASLDVFSPGAVVDPDALHEKGLIGRLDRPVKLLAKGDVKVPLTVRVPSLSAKAQEKILAAGGTVELLEGPEQI